MCASSPILAFLWPGCYRRRASRDVLPEYVANLLTAFVGDHSSPHRRAHPCQSR